MVSGHITAFMDKVFCDKFTTWWLRELTNLIENSLESVIILLKVPFFANNNN